MTRDSSAPPADGGDGGPGVWFGGLGRGKRVLLAIAMGVASVTAFAPFHIIPVLIPAFTVLVWLVHGAGRYRDVFTIGLGFGFGHFFGGLYWLSNAFAVVGGPVSAIAWPAVISLSLFLALYPAGVCASYRWLTTDRRFGPWEAALFAGLWTLGEWLRGSLFTGFPWNPVGSVWDVSDAVLQVTSLVGVYGLGMLTVFCAVAFVGNWWQTRSGMTGHGWCLPIAVVVIVACVWGGGTYRLAHAPDVPDVADVNLRLVQPNIAQHLKWQYDLRSRHVLDQIAMSNRPPANRLAEPSHIIWAETAVPFYVARQPALLEALGDAAPEGGFLIVGGLRRSGPEPEARRFNSLLAIGPDGQRAAFYDKVHLVPFGEYMPFAGVLPFGKLTAGDTDFSPGAVSGPIDLPGLPAFQPLICYEAIFPGAVVDTAHPRPGWLLNATNDAWYGVSSGPRQHFAMVRIRAVEEGLPVVRVANTGISAVIDSYGRVRARLDLAERGVIDSPLPGAIAPTVFATTGHAPVIMVAFALVAVSIRQRRRKRQSAKGP